MGKHVNAEATNDEVEADAASDGMVHHAAARHSTEGEEQLAAQPGTPVDTDEDDASGIAGALE